LIQCEYQAYSGVQLHVGTVKARKDLSVEIGEEKNIPPVAATSSATIVKQLERVQIVN